MLTDSKPRKLCAQLLASDTSMLERMQQPTQMSSATTAMVTDVANLTNSTEQKHQCPTEISWNRAHTHTQMLAQAEKKIIHNTNIYIQSLFN